MWELDKVGCTRKELGLTFALIWSRDWTSMKCCLWSGSDNFENGHYLFASGILILCGSNVERGMRFWAFGGRPLKLRNNMVHLATFLGPTLAFYTRTFSAIRIVDLATRWIDPIYHFMWKSWMFRWIEQSSGSPALFDGTLPNFDVFNNLFKQYNPFVFQDH